jgi:hypothetical protein
MEMPLVRGSRGAVEELGTPDFPYDDWTSEDLDPEKATGFKEPAPCCLLPFLGPG